MPIPLFHRLIWAATPPSLAAVYYDSAYRLPITALESQIGIEPRRADFVAWYLLRTRALRRSDLVAPPRATYEDLARVHSSSYLESLTRRETLALIFSTDPTDIPVDEVLGTLRLACGATLAAARAALERRLPAINLIGGFHHAAPDRGGGFCAVNDIAVAVAALRAEGWKGRVGVLDLDAHPPDGTAACFASDADTWIGSLSGSNWGSLPARVDETVLPPGSTGHAYVPALDAMLRRMPAVDLSFVIAGGDVLAGDRLGTLGLTLADARERDRRVARVLSRTPAVWLPGGGYHHDAWRVFASTAMLVARGVSAPVPAKFDPLTSRFRSIAQTLSNRDLAGFSALTDEDVDATLAPHAGKRGDLLGFYSAEGIEYALARYGVLEQARRLGYRDFRIALDQADAGHRIRVFGRFEASEYLLTEAVLERNRIANDEVLWVHWLMLQNPRGGFSEARPKLPGQEHPGLGLAREAGEILALMARRLGLAGVAVCPAWYHVAYGLRYRFRFLDPARSGRFAAMLRDFAGRPLLDVTRAVAGGRVRMNGQPYAWEAEPMVYWLDGRSVDDATATAERDRVRFEIVG
jgi:acetoin utilization deacetylase AcuC-like enzyme